jgi:type VI secretion system protein ImpH
MTPEFFGHLRALEAKAADRPRIGRSLRRTDDVVRFGQLPHVNFAPAAAAAAGEPDEGTARLDVYFMGLLGPMGPMPLHLTELALFERRYVKEKALNAFLGVLENRLVQLFYRAWADAEPMAQRDRPASDRFFFYVSALGSLSGAGASVPAGLEALAGFAGQIAARRGASAIADVAGEMLGVEARVEEFVGVWHAIEPQDQTRLGRAYATLGRDTVAGGRSYSVQDGARLRLLFRSLPDYEAALPGRPGHAVLMRLVSALMPGSLDWRVEYELPEREAAPVRLGSTGRLGWTGWLQPNPKSDAVRRDLRLAPAA